ncbi:MAG: hypothetical protein KIT46_08835 [Anaerolineales bacterium]|nr:hypothetical protein [Anaerolineales bacterium]MCW5856134.1 hypothetical protein [Anaerolineales bacterium]
MDELSFTHRLRRLWNKLRILGLQRAVKSLYPRKKADIPFPLAGADPDLLLAPGITSIRDYARKRSGQAKKSEASKDRSTQFPLIYQHASGDTMRYALFPALAESKGLITIFHGYLGFEIEDIRYSWRQFDLLLPLDSYGYKNLGSWFWGEKGDNHVEKLTNALIRKVQAERNPSHWFTLGTSMGGFAALYHGIKYQADGIYTMTPIIDLKKKAAEYYKRGIETSYTALAHPDDLEFRGLPDVCLEAERAEALPPLFLIQNQYDRSNPFGEDTLPLVQSYTKKKGWLGLRVHPAIGHQGHDGSYEEARYFFSTIVEKSPPKVVDFYDQDDGG